MGFFVVGPSVQRAIFGCSGTKFMAPGVVAARRTKPLTSPAVTVDTEDAEDEEPQLEIELQRMQAQVVELQNVLEQEGNAAVLDRRQSQIERVQTMVVKKEDSANLSYQF